MTSVRIAIVAHEARRRAAVQLADDTRALGVSIDDGTLGCEGNHRRVWDWHTDAGPCHDWAVTLEDDAQPAPGFRDQLAAALAVAPAPIVSLYLGTGYPPLWQPRIRKALDGVDVATSWLTADSLLHAVAVAIRTDLLDTLELQPGYAPDYAITRWARRHGHPIAYTVPSLVDHADTEPVTTVRYDRLTRHKPRKAWVHGTRAIWTAHTAAL
ncbi:glycosyltransferase family 2 protein [Mycobacterium sp. PSTR-4-N]|uniref:glycosyltransferase family 2 protein n=1 Tax=Mycobacterium sp. PSTR-4-N TaxID=2917745 RepID=UPI001F150503|nr:glycosyltransferase family 2 protein [Mycobacterium sp. PSTR-4-N]MCG7592401.1 glycosyltransferase family 2 protein [Mycobacterium sp. PSTR-4-N]